MASGVQVSEICHQMFRELKLGKNKSKKLKYIIYNLNKDMTEIIVEKSSEDTSYDKFLEDLPPSECRWAVYDIEFEKDGKRNKLCFISWSPDTAKIRPKMVFASSRDALKRTLDGISVEIQATDPTEVEYETVLNKAKASSR